MQRKFSFLEHFLHVHQHAFADSRDRENFLRFVDQVGNLLRLSFNRFGGIAVGADAEGILAVNFKQVGSFVKDAGDGFVVHVR